MLHCRYACPNHTDMLPRCLNYLSMNDQWLRLLQEVRRKLVVEDLFKQLSMLSLLVLRPDLLILAHPMLTPSASRATPGRSSRASSTDSTCS